MGAGKDRGGSRCAGVVVCASLAGCSLGKPPAGSDLVHTVMPASLAPPPALWAARTGATTAAAGEVGGGWLRSFQAPGLEELVWEALRYNVDYQVAAARLEQAAGYARLAGAAVLPQVNVVGRGSQGGGDADGLVGVRVAASWELDLWGRVRYGRAAAEADYASAEYDLRYARESLAALVVKSWFLATEARQQRDLAQEMIRASERLLSLANDRARVGLGDDLEIAQAAGEPRVRARLRAEARRRRPAGGPRAGAARGRYPKAELEVPAQLVAMPGPVPVGLPSELLERRPDVIGRGAPGGRRLRPDRRGEGGAAAPPVADRATSAPCRASCSCSRTPTTPSTHSRGTCWHPSSTAAGSRPRSRSGPPSRRRRSRATRRSARAPSARSRPRSPRSSRPRRARRSSPAPSRRTRRRSASPRRATRSGRPTCGRSSSRSSPLAAARSQQLRVEAERRVQRVNVHLALGGNFEHPEAAAVAYPQKKGR